MWLVIGLQACCRSAPKGPSPDVGQLDLAGGLQSWCLLQVQDSGGIVERLLGLLDIARPHVTAEAIIQIAHVLRAYPDMADVCPTLWLFWVPFPGHLTPWPEFGLETGSGDGELRKWTPKLP